MIDAPAFTVPLAKFIQHKVEKSFFDKARMEERFNEVA